MGPPIYIGGNMRERFGIDVAIPGFNGATDLHRWKHAGALRDRRGNTGLQWGHRFTSVETEGGLVGSPRRGGCFNGATDLHRWKLLHLWLSAASAPCFNGATDLHRWKQIHDFEGYRGARCFNGATDLHRWKRV